MGPFRPLAKLSPVHTHWHSRAAAAADTADTAARKAPTSPPTRQHFRDTSGGRLRAQLFEKSRSASAHRNLIFL